MHHHGTGMDTVMVMDMVMDTVMGMVQTTTIQKRNVVVKRNLQLNKRFVYWRSHSAFSALIACLACALIDVFIPAFYQAGNKIR